jgi:DEAD/DEAH box helicase domain-containing protein
MENFIQQANFTIKYSYLKEGRAAETVHIDNLQLDSAVGNFLRKYNHQVFKHQYEALRLFKEGHNICVSTSTGSGKSDVFFMCGIEYLSKNPDGKILAIYPAKALGRQQETRWESALGQVVGRIDGDVETQERLVILSRKRVIIMTPDVIHAWLLPKLKETKDFLAKVGLVIVDEIHTYTGTFGSNSGYLFRRLRYASDIINDKNLQFIAASATIKDPDIHLNNVIGVDFSIIERDHDTSPKFDTSFYLIESNYRNRQRIFNDLRELLRSIILNTEKRVIVFVDSRTAAAEEAREIDMKGVYSFRAGMEEADAQQIQKNLENGTIKAVYSTSALEMGIDIKGLDMCILFGIPNSETSFYQRIGRIARHDKGVVLVINDNSIRSTSIFREPSKIHNLPLTESKIYLDNEFLQVTQSLCLIKEHKDTGYSIDFERVQNIFPDNFASTVKAVQENKLSGNYLYLLKGNTNYHHKFPIRNFDVLFRVISNDHQPLGNLTFFNVMKEAYPFANWIGPANISYRVSRVDKTTGIVYVFKNNANFAAIQTRPIVEPSSFMPLTEGKFFDKFSYGSLEVLDSELEITERVTGITQRSIIPGMPIQNINEHHYPIRWAEGLQYLESEFTNKFNTTGIVFSHPSFKWPDVEVKHIGKIIKEVFTMQNVIDPLEVDFGKAWYKNVPSLFIFDKHIGSLRLSSRLAAKNVLIDVLDEAITLTDQKDIESFLGIEGTISARTIESLKALRKELDC